MTTFPTAVDGVIATASEYNAVAAALSAILTGGGKVDINQFSGPVSPQVFNVRSAAYGALGNDAHDDAPAILAARADAVAAGAGVIELPPGVYRLRAPLTGGNKITLRGAGAGVTIIRADAAIGGCLYDGGAWTDFHVEGITFDANSQTATSAFQLYNGGHTRLRISGCQFIGAAGAWNVNIGGFPTASTDVLFANNVVGACSPGTLEGCLLSNLTDSAIVGNTFRDWGGTLAAALGLYAYMHNVVVGFNRFTNNVNGGDCYIQQSDTVLYTHNMHRATAIGEVGLTIRNCVDVVVEGGIFAGFASGGFANSGVVLADFAGTLFDGAHTALYQSSARITVQGVRFTNTYSGVSIGAASGSGHTYAMSQIHVKGCTFNGVLYTGVLCGSPVAVNMSGIHVSDCAMESAGPAGFGIVEVAGNPGFTPVTTTQAITANAAPQTVTVSGTPAGLVAGQTATIDTGGNQETFQVQSVNAGVSIVAIFAKSHTITQTIALDPSVVGKGIAGVVVERLHTVPATGSNCSGVHIDTATDVRLYGNDLRSTGTGGHGNVYLTGGGAYAEAKSNQGLNPVGLLGPPAIPATGVGYVNTYGVDAMFAYRGGTTSVIAVDGVTLATTTPAFVLVPNGSTVAVTYSAAPTLAVYGL